jgi:transposase InsO family protein
VIRNVLYVPRLGTNLFSIGAATKAGSEVHFVEETVTFVRCGRTEIQGQRVENTLYYLNILAKETTGSPTALTVKRTGVSLATWHDRFAHLNFKTILKMVTLDNTTGLNVSGDNTDCESSCEGCILGKMHRFPFKIGRTRAMETGQLVHTDICGPMQVPTPSGSRYFVIFKDDYSRWTVTRFLKKKSQLDQCLREFVTQLKGETNKEVKTIRSDNGGEYFGGELVTWLAERGIRHESSAPHSPQQNGVSERTMRTLMEAARSQMYAMKVPIELWGESVASATYVLNRSSTTKSDVTPFERWHGKKPDVAHLRTFGCQAFVHVPDAVRRKLDAKAKMGIMVGYCNESKAYRVWNPDTRRVLISRDVIFNEEKIPLSAESNTDYSLIFPEELEGSPVTEMTSSDSVGTLPTAAINPPKDISMEDTPPTTELNEEPHPGDLSPVGGLQPDAQQSTPSSSNQIQQTTEVVQPRRTSRKPILRFENFKGLVSSSSVSTTELTKSPAEPFEPLSYQQALSCDQADQWKAAILEEYESLK